jgi:hypothetical protein
MLIRICLERLLPFHGQIDFARRHGAFFDNAVGDHHSDPAMKEVKHPIMKPLIACSQFVNLIPEIVCFGAAQLMPHLLKPLESNQALPLSPGRNAVQPLDQRYRAFIFPVKENINACQVDPFYVLIIGNTGQPRAKYVARRQALRLPIMLMI